MPEIITNNEACLTVPQPGFDLAFGKTWKTRIPPSRDSQMLKRRWNMGLPRAGKPVWEQHIPFWSIPCEASRGGSSERSLLSDIWEPLVDVARSTSSSLQEEVDACITEAMNRLPIPGLAVGIVKGNQVLYLHGTATAILMLLVFFLTLLLITYIVARQRLRAELASQSQIVRTSLGPVEYVDIGKGPVIFHAHGMLGGSDHMRYCEFLVRNGFRLIVPSRPGYLRTPLASGKTPREQAALYAALLDTLCIDQATFYAISQGGASSLEFALTHPERCRSLVLVSAFTQPQQSSEFRKVLPYIRALFSLDFVMWLLKPLILLVIMGQARKALPLCDLQDTKKMASIEHFFSTISQASLRGQGLINDFDNLFHWPGVALNQIKVPTLLIHGANDPFVKWEDSAASANQMPCARFLLLPDAGHEAFITRVEQIECEMLPLLRANTPSTQGLA